MTPAFCDINLKNLALDEEKVLNLITDNTGAILLTHILGYNGMTQKIIDICNEREIVLIEDVCESHGATFNGKKAGTLGDISNFSFYYAHHMTTIEGGMICTDNQEIYERARILRSHGLLRETENQEIKTTLESKFPQLNPEFIFMQESYNFRSTELNAVLGLNQLKQLDENNSKRIENLKIFLENLNPARYHVDFDQEGNSNYAFTLLLQEPNLHFRDKIEETLKENEVEFRRGMSGGGNQLRQPYLTRRYGTGFANLFPNVDHVHSYGWYIGNYPDLPKEDILWLTDLLNNVDE